MKSMKKTRTGNMKLTVKAIFETEVTALKGHQRWCRAFYDHMQGLDGKTLNEQNANRRARQLFTILHSNDPNSDTLDCLYQEKGSKIWDEWAKPKLEKKSKAGIVIFYLTSLEKFLNFALEEQNEDDSNLAILDEKAVKVSRKLGAWHSTIHKEYMSDNWKTVLNETCNRVKPSDIKYFNETEPALQVKKLLEEAITRELHINEYCIMRNYLLTSLLVQNGQRPRALEEVLLDDFNHAEADPVTGIHTIFAMSMLMQTERSRQLKPQTKDK